MTSLLDQVRELEREKQSNRSRVAFSGNFLGELKKLMGSIEETIVQKVLPKYEVEYTDFGNHSMKIKIKDTTLMIEKLIVCNFTYKKNDEKYGYIEPQFIVSEKSQKTKVYDLGKFSIINTDTIVGSFIEKLIDIIEEF